MFDRPLRIAHLSDLTTKYGHRIDSMCVSTQRRMHSAAQDAVDSTYMFDVIRRPISNLWRQPI